MLCFALSLRQGPIMISLESKLASNLRSSRLHLPSLELEACTTMLAFFLLSFLETGSPYVAETGLELMVLLPPSPKD